MSLQSKNFSPEKSSNSKIDFSRLSSLMLEREKIKRKVNVPAGYWIAYYCVRVK
jgi:hypothetical protein